MANTSIDHLSLDFASIKDSLKTYLRNVPQFKDYDFEGSNINVLLDILAYNTHKNSFYYNMVISEAFLDSAQTLGAVVSHAKDLNYVPKSKSSAQATVRVTFEATGDSSPYIIPKGAPFSTLVRNQTYVFTLPENKYVSSGNTTFTFEASIYEGQFVSDTYVINIDEEGTRYRITNKNVDIDSIEVKVFEDGATVSQNYSRVDTLLGLTDQSKVFFLQAVGNGYYEVLFGDNIFGRKPKIGSTIVIEYRVSNGDDGNGAKVFSVDFDPTGTDELLSTPIIETIDVAADGSEEQTIESIRAYAPRYFATQQRAVASDDYASLVLAEFAGKIDDVIVYGGETVEPKLYGRTIIAVKPATGDIVPDFIKSDIINYLDRFVGIPARVELTDPEYFNADCHMTVQYDPTITTKTKSELEGLITDAILNYSLDNLERFDADFRFSRFVRYIDEVDDSIVSNDTTNHLTKRFYPVESQYFTADIDYNNPSHPGRQTLAFDSPVFYTDSFTYIAPDSTEYTQCFVQDDGYGTLIIYRFENSNRVILNTNIGSINYNAGTVSINKLLGKDYGDYFRCHLITQNKDIIMSKAKILRVDADDIFLTVIPKVE